MLYFESEFMESITNSMPLSNRTAVITGASGGMGSAIAARLVAEGAAVAVLGRRTEKLDQLAAGLSDGPGRIVPVTTDITSETDVEAAVATIHEALGEVDLLVNAAGVMLANPLSDGRSDEWETMIETNLTGLLRVTRAFLPDLLGHKHDVPADIINISSIAAHVVFPDYAVYAATKAAVTALSAMQRTEIARDGVRVTNIEPGLTDTELGTHLDNDRLRSELQSMFAAIEPIKAVDIADLVHYVVTRPANVNLRQVMILPTLQA
ncbi:SDR family oxidoreductase [Microbacterium gorillae]|uniref:SDR family oxidoreductase n=1 Tax=Microbacterium gorillae TaxID=1231063 RepID=UPI001E2D5844|nr:SDR family oxidoreductase [Microbacterium gorillae]